MARLAGPAEMATKAEAQAVPWMRFLHQDQPLPAEAGLVIDEWAGGFVLRHR